MIKTIALGCRVFFSCEEWSETYFKYVEVNAAAVRNILRQELQQQYQLCWPAIRRGA